MNLAQRLFPADRGGRRPCGGPRRVSGQVHGIETGFGGHAHGPRLDFGVSRPQPVPFGIFRGVGPVAQTDENFALRVVGAVDGGNPFSALVLQVLEKSGFCLLEVIGGGDTLDFRQRLRNEILAAHTFIEFKFADRLDDPLPCGLV